MPKVADFGLAKFLDADLGLTQTDSVLGSPSYMAPEQAVGKAKNIGPRRRRLCARRNSLRAADRAPHRFRGENGPGHAPAGPRVRAGHFPLRFVPGLPRDIETITLKCLQKDPGRRYDSGAAMAEDLRRFQVDLPIVARPVGWPERARRWCRRNPAPAISVAAVAMTLCLGTVVSMNVRGSPPGPRLAAPRRTRSGPPLPAGRPRRS